MYPVWSSTARIIGCDLAKDEIRMSLTVTNIKPKIVLKMTSYLHRTGKRGLLHLVNMTERDFSINTENSMTQKSTHKFSSCTRSAVRQLYLTCASRNVINNPRPTTLSLCSDTFWSCRMIAVYEGRMLVMSWSWDQTKQLLWTAQLSKPEEGGMRFLVAERHIKTDLVYNSRKRQYWMTSSIYVIDSRGMTRIFIKVLTLWRCMLNYRMDN